MSIICCVSSLAISFINITPLSFHIRFFVVLFLLEYTTFWKWLCRGIVPVSFDLFKASSGDVTSFLRSRSSDLREMLFREGGGGYIPDFSRQVICFFSGIMSVSKKYCTLMLDYLHIYASPGGKKFYICDSPMRQVLLMDVQCIYLTFM